MSRLIAANLVRMKKNILFWICMGVMVIMAVLILYGIDSSDVISGVKETIGNKIFCQVHLVGLLIAAFSSMLIGSEYHDGTIRNKIAVGHKRSSIYFANMITLIIAGSCFFVMYDVVFILAGIPLFGFGRLEAKSVFYALLLCILIIILFSSLYTFIAMCIQNRSIVMLICVISFFALLFEAMRINELLRQEPTYTPMEYVDGEFIEKEEVPNPYYVSGFKRDVYEFLFDLLPSGQSVQITSWEVDGKWNLAIYSLVVSIVNMGIGLSIFQRRDIK